MSEKNYLDKVATYYYNLFYLHVKTNLPNILIIEHTLIYLFNTTINIFFILFALKRNQFLKNFCSSSLSFYSHPKHSTAYSMFMIQLKNEHHVICVVESRRTSSETINYNQ